jgi:hypothetical protein
MSQQSEKFLLSTKCRQNGRVHYLTTLIIGSDDTSRLPEASYTHSTFHNVVGEAGIELSIPKQGWKARPDGNFSQSK